MSEAIRVLLIDDDEDEYILLRSLLAKAGAERFGTCWTPSYAQGLQRIAQRDFDVYLIDYSLGRSGFELLAEAVAGGCEDPLIVLTGSNSFALQATALQSGAVDVTARILEELRMAHPRRELRFARPELLPLHWDPERYGQVVGNLVKNALDYGDATRPIVVTLRATGTGASLSVHNQGAPIPTHIQAQLFDPFRRAVSSDEPASEGLGLGLYIVERIVAGHGAP